MGFDWRTGDNGDEEGFSDGSKADSNSIKTIVFPFYLEGVDLVTINVVIEMISRIFYGAYYHDEYYVRLLQQGRIIFLGPSNPEALTSITDYFSLNQIILKRWKNQHETEESSPELCAESGFGVNIAYNFPIGFSSDQTSSSSTLNPCDPYYRGNYPLSEPESFSIFNFFLTERLSLNIQIVIQLSPVGKSLLLPFSYLESSEPVESKLTNPFDYLYFPEGFEAGTLYALENKTQTGQLTDTLAFEMNISSGIYRLGVSENDLRVYHPPKEDIVQIGMENVPSLFYLVGKLKDSVLFLSQGVCDSDVSACFQDSDDSETLSYFVSVEFQGTSIDPEYIEAYLICVRFSLPDYFVLTQMFNDDLGESMSFSALEDDTLGRFCSEKETFISGSDAMSITIVFEKNMEASDTSEAEETRSLYLVFETHDSIGGEISEYFVELADTDFWMEMGKSHSFPKEIIYFVAGTLVSLLVFGLFLCALLVSIQAKNKKNIQKSLSDKKHNITISELSLEREKLSRELDEEKNQIKRRKYAHLS